MGFVYVFTIWQQSKKHINQGKYSPWRKNMKLKDKLKKVTLHLSPFETMVLRHFASKVHNNDKYALAALFNLALQVEIKSKKDNVDFDQSVKELANMSIIDSVAQLAKVLSDKAQQSTNEALLIGESSDD